MREIAWDVSSIAPIKAMTGEGVILALVNMNFRVRKIGQTAAVIEVHVREDDVVHIFGFISETLNLIDRRIPGIKWHVRDDAKEIGEPGRVGVIAQTKSCVHEYRTLVSLHQQAKRARFHFGGKARIAGKAIEQMNVHDLI